jgi:hypothetical protein
VGWVGLFVLQLCQLCGGIWRAFRLQLTVCWSILLLSTGQEIWASLVCKLLWLCMLTVPCRRCLRLCTMLSPHQASPWYMAALQQVSKSTSPMFLRSSLGFFLVFFLPHGCSYFCWYGSCLHFVHLQHFFLTYNSSWADPWVLQLQLLWICLHFVDFPTLSFSHTIPYEQTLEYPGCCCYGSCLHFVDFPCFLSDIQLFTSRHMNPQAPLWLLLMSVEFLEFGFNGLLCFNCQISWFLWTRSCLCLCRVCIVMLSSKCW